MIHFWRKTGCKSRKIFTANRDIINHPAVFTPVSRHFTAPLADSGKIYASPALNNVPIDLADPAESGIEPGVPSEPWQSLLLLSWNQLVTSFPRLRFSRLVRLISLSSLSR